MILGKNLFFYIEQSIMLNNNRNKQRNVKYI